MGDDNYYRVQSKGKLPVRWMALESLEFRKVLPFTCAFLSLTCVFFFSSIFVVVFGEDGRVVFWSGHVGSNDIWHCPVRIMIGVSCLFLQLCCSL